MLGGNQSGGPDEKSAEPGQFARFGVFIIDFAAGELHKNGRKVKLEAQPFQVLGLLVRRPGEVVTREELRQELWPDNTFVDFDHSLGTAIKKVRDALGDSARNPRFVETLPRKGYRFIGPVDGVAQPAAAIGPATGRPGARRRRWLVWASALLAVSITAAFAAWLLLSRPEETPRLAQLSPVPVTTFPGEERYPAISPDGKFIAYCMDGNLYVQAIGSETVAPTQRTNSAEYDFSPAWSPDSLQIAFWRSASAEKGPRAILAMGAYAGPERTLHQVAGESLIEEYAGWARLAWSPGGDSIAFVDRESRDAPESLWLLDLDSRRVTKLTEPPASAIVDFSPSFSPDGGKLAFVRVHSHYDSDVNLLRLSSDRVTAGVPEALTSGGWQIDGLDWRADGERIVFSDRGERWGLWSVPVTGGQPTRLALGSRDIPHFPSISREGSRLTFATLKWLVNIWQLPGPNAEAGGAPGKETLAEPLFPSTKTRKEPRYSPNGKWIAYSDSRSGSEYIWRADSDGTNLLRLSSGPGRTPRWSPDSRWVVFMCGPKDHRNICVVNAEGGQERRLTVHDAKDSNPNWSRDGKSVYFASDLGGDWQVWRIPADGGRPARQVTAKGGIDAFESADRQSLYYTKPWPSLGIWKMTLASGDESKVVDLVEDTRWEVFEDGLCYQCKKDSGTTIECLRFDTGQTEHIADCVEGLCNGNGFSVSPDGQSILVARNDPAEGDIMLVENFQ